MNILILIVFLVAIAVALLVWSHYADKASKARNAYIQRQIDRIKAESSPFRAGKARAGEHAWSNRNA